MRTACRSRPSPPLALLAAIVVVAAGCSKSAGTNAADTASAAANTPGQSPANTATMLRGAVVSVSSTNLVVKVDTGNAAVALAQPFQIYDQEPATLADVKDGTFIGVTTVKQPDGSERATEIHIFPDALRGLGEGSRMMTPSAAGPNGANGSGSRMTNGAVAGSRMTNGSASTAPPASRMSNGSVAGATGSSFVVSYSGGSQHVVVPATTTVTAIKATSRSLAPGDQIVVLTKRAADGSVAATSALLVRP